VSYGKALELAVLLAGRNPHWTERTRYGGAPTDTNDGVSLREAPVTHLCVQLREVLRYRRGRVSVSTVENNETYSVGVRQSTASYGSDADATEAEVVEGLELAVNALRLDVRARAVDEDGDGSVDTLYLESNHTALYCPGPLAGETYTVTIDGTAYTYTADAWGASNEEILGGLAQAINAADAPARAHTIDTTGDGDTDTLFLEPTDARSLTVTVDATGEGMLALEASGAQSDNPAYTLPGSTGDAQLALDADAVGGEVYYYHTLSGESQTPEGWHHEPQRQWTVDYRGLRTVVPTGGESRGYISFQTTGEGTPRYVGLGPAVEEN